MHIEIDWMEGFGNSPKFVLYAPLNMIPRMESSEFKFHDGMWVHVADNGFVRYFHHDGSNKNAGGYGGAEFKFLYNGRPRSVLGPWSSRAGCVNNVGYDVVDVVLRDGSLYSACITFELLMQILNEQQPNFHVVQVQGRERVYYPSMKPDCVEKPNGQRIDSGRDFITVWSPNHA